MMSSGPWRLKPTAVKSGYGDQGDRRRATKKK